MKSQNTSRRFWMAMVMGTALLLSLALAGNTGGTCTPLDPTPFCAADSDCDGVPPVDCVGDWACDAGTCVFECDDPTLPPNGCTSDADCRSGEFCAIEDANDCCPADAWCFMYMPVCEGECRPVEPPPVECRTDRDCAAGEICVEEWDECPPPPGCRPGDICPAVCGPAVIVGAHCEPFEPPPVQCWSDSDCGPGMRCDFDPWMNCAVPDCPDGADCDTDGLWNCGGVCVPVEPPPVDCWSDADCGPGMRCEIDPWTNCGVPSCPDGAACDPAEYWNCGGVCVPVEPPPAECWSDWDCGPGMRCELLDDCGWPDCPAGAECGAEAPDAARMACGGRCVPVEPPPVECWSDRDCGPGMRCEIPADCGWAGCPPDEMCEDMDWMACGGRCVPVEPPPVECWSNSDCPAGMRCELLDWCTGECPEGAGCDWICGGQCVPVEPPPVECWSNADCGPGMACEFYENCAVPDCADEDCGQPFWGCAGRCVPVQPPPRECLGDADCGPGMRCDFPPQDFCCPPGELCLDVYMACLGVCVPDDPNPNYPYCTTDAECRDGEICEPIYVAYGEDMGAAEMPCFDADGDGWCDDMYPTGICTPVEPPPVECFADADCPAGTHCEQGSWAGGAGGAGFAPCFDENGDGICDWDQPYPGGVCVPNDPPTGECLADWDCAADERCELDWDYCDMNCGPNMNCMPCVGRCVPIKECLDDADCPGGTICDYDAWGCFPFDCDGANGEDCVPLPCMGVCSEPDFGSQA